MSGSKRVAVEPKSYEVPVVVTGVSFRTLDVAGREMLAQKAARPAELGASLVRDGVAREAAVVSTCNRFEVISVGGHVALIREALRKYFGADLFTDRVVYQHSDEAAVRHVYRVAASLDSMVLGEAQILGQVKQAYRDAVAAASVGPQLHHLFQSAFHVAKRVRANTDVAQHGVSVSYVAVRLAQQIFSDLSDTAVLVVGSGEMAELAALHLRAQGCGKIVVANRTLERAAELAARFGGSAISLSDIARVIDEVDIVIGSIAIDRPIIGRQLIAARQRERALFLIDLGLPRNFAAELDELDEVYLYNIDDLAVIAQENKSLREVAAKEAELVIDHGLLQFERWRTRLLAKPELVDIRAKVQAICTAELMEALSATSDESREEVVRQTAYAISQKVAHELTEVLERQRGVARDEDGIYPYLIVSHTKSK
jgi:glutamyl-tRNA reductase